MNADGLRTDLDRDVRRHGTSNSGRTAMPQRSQSRAAVGARTILRTPSAAANGWQMIESRTRAHLARGDFDLGRVDLAVQPLVDLTRGREFEEQSQGFVQVLPGFVRGQSSPRSRRASLPHR